MKIANRFFLASLLALALFGCSRPDPRAEAESRMKRALLLVLVSVNDTKDLVYPDLSTPDAAKQSLQSALSKQQQSPPSDGDSPWDEAVFIHPSSNSPFVPNANLSNLPASKVEIPANIIAFYAPQPDGDKRLAGYSDGHIEWIDEANWPLKKDAGWVK